MKKALLVVLLLSALPVPSQEPPPGLTESEKESFDVGGLELVEVTRLTKRAQQHEAAGDFKQALDGYQEALEVYEARFAWDPVGTFTLLELTGMAAYRLGRPQEAEAHLLRLTSLLEAHQPENPKLGKALSMLGVLAYESRDFERAEELCLKAQTLYESLGGPPSRDLVSTYLNRAKIAVAEGKLLKAADLIHSADDVLERVGPSWDLVRARRHQTRADLAMAQGNLAEAESFYQKALELRRADDPAGSGTAFSLGNLGGIALRRGRFDQAEAYYRRGLDILRKLAPGSPGVAAGLNSLATLHLERGELDKANQALRESLAIKRRYGADSPVLLEGLMNLVSLEVRLGKVDQAQKTMSEALKHVGSLPDNDPDRVLALLNLAVLRGLEQPSTGLEMSRELRDEIAQTAPESYPAAIAHLSVAFFHWQQGAYDRVIQPCLEAIGVLEALAPGSLLLATAHSVAANALARSGERDEALAQVRKALDAIDRQVPRLGGSYDLQTQFLGQHSGVLSRPVGALVDLERWEEAFHGLERYRAKAFLMMLMERDAVFGRDVPEALEQKRLQIEDDIHQVQEILSGLNLRTDGPKIKGAQTALRLLRQKADDIQSEIRLASPRLASLRYPEPLTRRQAIETLDPGTLMVSYMVRNDSLVIFAVAADGTTRERVVRIQKKELERRVEKLLGLIRSGEPVRSQSDDFYNLSHSLYNQLLGHLEWDTRNADRLLIVPDGPLHRLPFGALVLQSMFTGARIYLAEVKPLHFALSATVYSELKGRRESAGSAELDWMGIGAPSYPPDSPWPELPGARQELEAVAALFSAEKRVVYTGADAGEWWIKYPPGSPRILHVAAHGSLERRATDSYLALASAGPRLWSSAQVGRPPSNEQLQVWEIFQQARLSETELVVLSACDAGSGETAGGEGLIGFTRAFQYSGARSVLASSWTVEDTAGRELMVRFYRHLLSGKSKDEALMAAQKELINEPLEPADASGESKTVYLGAPRNWAGFQLYGDYR